MRLKRIQDAQAEDFGPIDAAKKIAASYGVVDTTPILSPRGEDDYLVVVGATSFGMWLEEGEWWHGGVRH